MINFFGGCFITNYSARMNLHRLIKTIFNHSFIRFLFVAGINTCFGYLMFAGCVYVLKDKYISVIVATIIAILFNFQTYGRIVFKSKDHSRIYRFFAVYLFMMGIQILLLKILDIAGLKNPYIAGGILTLPMAGMSFVLMRKFVFQRGAIKIEPSQKLPV